MADYDEQALRDDANDCWQPWSLELQKWGETIDGLTVSRPAFSLVTGAEELHTAFTAKLAAVRDYIHDGEEVFEGIARALLDTAMNYMEMEGYAQEAIDEVAAEMDAL